MTSFKIHGLRVYQKDSGVFYIQFSRSQRRSLNTRDKAEAKEIGSVIAEKYFQKKIIALKVGSHRLISEYLEEFIKKKPFDSKGSIRGYRTAVNVLIEFIGDKMMHTVTDDDIEKFTVTHSCQRSDTRKGKLSSLSINTYLVRLKSMFSKAAKEGIIKSCPEFSKIKDPKRLPVILPQDDKDRLLQYIQDNDFRFYQICRFALYTGCRRAEIISAMWEKFNGFTLKVVGKGNRERTVPLVQQAIEAMGERQKQGPIFWQAHPDTYSHYFKEYAIACGIQDISFHKMRHTAATEMLEAGINIAVVQKILGHTDLSTTQIYAHVMDKFLMEEMGKFGKCTPFCTPQNEEALSQCSSGGRAAHS